jgi:phosphoribosylanthranilate isomerase
MWVKICANTNAEDALAAVAAGADAVGFVFAPSVRQVTPDTVQQITALLPPGVERVGVFAASNADEIANAVRLGGLTAAQLHGGVDLPLAAALRKRLGPDFPIIHCVHWLVEDDDASEPAVRAQLSTLPDGARVLIDARIGKASGGLGKQFNWTRASAVVRQFPALNVIVAGGLRPENVAEAVRVFAPYGVDVATGVESSPGRKDREKLQRFLESARHPEPSTK